MSVNPPALKRVSQEVRRVSLHSRFVRLAGAFPSLQQGTLAPVHRVTECKGAGIMALKDHLIPTPPGMDTDTSQ